MMNVIVLVLGILTVVLINLIVAVITTISFGKGEHRCGGQYKADDYGDYICDGCKKPFPMSYWVIKRHKPVAKPEQVQR